MATSVQLGDPGREKTPPRLREDLRQRHQPAAAAVELRAMLGTLDLAPRRAAQLFGATSRSIRRWLDGTRHTPHGISILVRLLTARAVTVDQIAQATASTPTRTNGSAAPEPPAPLLVEPAPEQSAPAAALAILALAPGACRWPLGDPQNRDFCFCGVPVVAEPYCERHRALAYLAPRTGSGHGVRIGFVAHGRYSRPSIPGAFSATGASQAPKILFDCAGDLPGSAPPPA